MLRSKQHYLNILKVIHKLMEQDKMYSGNDIKIMLKELPFDNKEIRKALKYVKHQDKIKVQKINQYNIYWK